jgi:serralysin
MPKYTIFENEVFADQPIGPGMMGANFVTTHDFEIADSGEALDLLDSIGVTTLRFPGGSVTEDAFTEATFLTGDWNASSYTSDGATKTLTPMRDFFKAAAEVGVDVQLVIPTRVAFEQSAGQAIASGTFGGRNAVTQDYLDLVDRYVQEAMRLADEVGVKIARFELGNEFWGSGEMSAAEYGYLAGILATHLSGALPSIDVYMQMVSSANLYTPSTDSVVYLEPDGNGDFVVHPAANYSGGLPENWLTGTIPSVGNATRSNQIIAENFSAVAGAVENLAGVINHVYFSNGFEGIDDQRDFALGTTFDEFISALGAPAKLDLLISEWSPRGKNASGLQYAHAVIEAFFEMTSNGVDFANFWPTTFGDPNTLGRTLVDTIENDLTFGGVSFSWMTATMGHRPIFDYEVDGKIDVHGFGDASDMVLYVAERSGTDFNSLTEIDLGEFSLPGSYLVSISRLVSQDGSFLNDNANPLVTYENSFLTSGNSIILNLDPWELVMIELQQVTSSSDYLRGRQGNDTIAGALGEDTLLGGDGADSLKGQLDDDWIEGGNGDDVLKGGWGDDTVLGGNDNDSIFGGGGNDILVAESGQDFVSDGIGHDLISLGEGDDVVTLIGSSRYTAGYSALNMHSTAQAGTSARIDLEGFVRIEAVIDGGAGSDIVQLSSEGDAFFLHDAYSGFHSSVELTEDSFGNESTARFVDIEEIRGMGGDDLIDLTSPDYSLANIALTVDGGLGNDVIWGSDADETVSGGAGDDTIFGGTGNNVLTGGLGADVFEFTHTSADTSVTDFDAAEGDILRFYNGNSTFFDASSLVLTDTGISIMYWDRGSVRELEITISAAFDDIEFEVAFATSMRAMEIM